MSDVAAIMLQTCGRCGHVQYPDRELCARCLSDDIAHRRVENNRGRVVSWTVIHVSLDPVFQGRGPWRVGAVALDCGPLLFAHLAPDVEPNGARVQIASVEGPDGRAAWLAYAEGEAAPARPFSAKAL